MRGLLILLCAALLAGVCCAPAHAQVGFDRPGGDYASFHVRSGDPAVCAARCERDGRCRSWSFSYPGTPSPIAMCWLKNEVPAREENWCCVSGVKGAGVMEPRDGKVEFSVDRSGGDYRDLEVEKSPLGATCAAACEADDRCRAWTYLRPGYLGSQPRCFLKDRLTPPRRKPCCVSGVVR